MPRPSEGGDGRVDDARKLAGCRRAGEGRVKGVYGISDRKAEEA